MKKWLIAIIVIFILMMSFFISESLKKNKAYFIQDSIMADNYVLVDSTNGSNFEELDEEKIEYLIEVLKTVEFRRKIDLRPRGGWSYRLDFEIEDESYRIVFNGRDYLKINGDEFFISTFID